MPTEYLIVHCAQKRAVWIEDTYVGETDAPMPIELETGTYIVKLRPPDGCVPPLHEVVLLNTTLIKPCEVQFDLA